MRLSLHSPLGALCKALCLSALVYAISGPAFAPWRPDVVDVPLSRYHDAVNEVFADQRPTLAVITEPLRLSPHYARQHVAAMLRR